MNRRILLLGSVENGKENAFGLGVIEPWVVPNLAIQLSPIVMVVAA